MGQHGDAVTFMERGGPEPMQDRRAGVTIRGGVMFTVSMAVIVQLAVIIFQVGKMANQVETMAVQMAELRTSQRDVQREVSELRAEYARLSIRIQALESRR